MIKALILPTIFFFTLSIMAQSPNVVIQKGHSYSVRDAFYAANGRFLISYDEDNNLLAWDTKTAKIQKILKGHTSRILAAVPHPTQPLLFSGAEDSTLLVRNLSTDEIIRRYKGQSYAINHLSISPNGQYLIFSDGGLDGDMVLWDWEQDTILLKEQMTLSKGGFSKDGQYLLTLSPGKLHLWQEEAKHFKQFKTLENVWEFTLDTDGKYLAVANNKGVIKLYTFPDLQPIQAFGYKQQKIRSLLIHPNRPILCFLTVSGQLLILDWEKKQILQEQDIKGFKVDISEDGQYLAVSDFEHQIHLFDFLPNSESVHFWKAHDGFINQLYFEGHQLMSVAKDKTIRIWNYKSGNLLRTYKGRAKIINAIDYNNDGTYFGATVGKAAFLWQISKGFQVIPIFQHTVPLTSIVFGPQGKSVMGTTEDGFVWHWSQEQQQITMLKKAHRGMTEALAIASNNQWYATGGWDGAVKCWRKEKHELLWEQQAAHEGAVAAVAFSPDNQYVASCGMDGKIQLWEVNSGNKQATVAASHKVYDLKFSPTGKYLACTTEDNQLHLWNGQTLKKEGVIAIGDSLVWPYTLAFSPDEKLIACGGTDAVVRVWNLDNQQLLFEGKGHLGWILDMQFSPDGQYLTSASDDGTIRFWDLASQKEQLTLVPDENQSFVLLDNQGNYFCDKSSIEVVTYTIADKVYSFEQFDLIHNRPDLVLQNFSTVPSNLLKAYQAAYQKRLQLRNFKAEMLDITFQIPTLEIINTLPNATTNNIIDCSVKAFSSTQKLDRINVYINDVPIYGHNGLDLRGLNTNQLQQNIAIELSQGSNKVQFSVLNQGGIESLKETFDITYDRPKKLPNLHIIGIGVDNYLDPNMNLDYPTKDITDVGQLFKQKNQLFNNIQVTTLKNEQVTIAAIKELNVQLQSTQVDDCVIVFVAGHGLVDANYNYYLATFATDFLNPAAKGLPFQVLEDILDKIPARQKLLLMDACHSGEIDKTYVQRVAQVNKTNKTVKFRTIGDTTLTYTKFGLENSFELMKSLFVDLRRSTGTTVIASAGGVQQAQESDQWQNGAFTYALLEGLNTGKADLDGDGKIMISELMTFLQKKVPKLTKGLQQPTSRLENLSNDWRIW